MRGRSVIHRVSATWGMVAMVPVAVLLFQEELTLLGAGLRAAAIFGAVMCIRWVADRVVRGVAATLEDGSTSD